MLGSPQCYLPLNGSVMLSLHAIPHRLFIYNFDVPKWSKVVMTLCIFKAAKCYCFSPKSCSHYLFTKTSYHRKIYWLLPKARMLRILFNF